MKIKLYDETEYDYPIIIIQDGYIKDFKKLLKNYRKGNQDYNIEDFLELVEEQEYYINYIGYDDVEEVYF